MPTTSAPATATPRPTATSLPTPAPAVIADLARLAHPITTTEPGGNYDDLEPLREIVGDARIVSLGEATHGTDEFFTMKHRIIEFLVREMDFSIVAVEVPRPQMKPANNYILDAAGSIAVAMGQMNYWTIRTEEFRDLVEWLREHNAAADTQQPVSLSGFDMQVSTERVTQDIRSYLEQVDPGAVAEFANQFTVLAEPGETETVHERHLEAAEAIFAEILARRKAYVAASSPAAFEEALQDARVLVQDQDLNLTVARHGVGGSAQALRDRYMAENVSWLLEQAGPDAKTIVWAHNGHVGYQPQPITDAPSMGSHLKSRYGNDLVTLGFDFASGSVSARPVPRNVGGRIAEPETYVVPSPFPEMTAFTFQQAEYVPVDH